MEMVHESKKFKDFFKSHDIEIKEDKSVNCVTFVGKNGIELQIFSEVGSDSIPYIIVED